MKELVEYLKDYREEMPAWLKNYQPGDAVSFKDFMSGRIGYYPGSGDDGCLVKVANQAQCVHSFLYVDYGIEKHRLQKMVEEEDAFRGYHTLGRVEWSEKDLMPQGQYPLNVPMPRRDPRAFVNEKEKPYIFLEVFERNEDKGDDWGAERFAVAFLFADGIATYYQLFVKEYQKAPWLFLLQDHGFGGNYDKFGKGGLLDAILTENQVYPSFVLCADHTHIWTGYEMLEDVAAVKGGMHHTERRIFRKNI